MKSKNGFLCWIRANRLRIFLGTFSISLLVCGYLYLSDKQHMKNPDDTTIPTISQLREGLQHAFEVNKRSGERWIAIDAAATAKRFFIGVGLGIVSSIILGLLMGCFKPIEAFFYPPMAMLAKIPPTAALAVFFVMVGTDLWMYVSMIAFGMLPSMSQSVFLAVKDVPDENLYKAETLGASRFALIWNIIFSQIRPRIIDAIRLQIGPAMVYLIAAEMICSDVGFGYRIRLQSRLLDMSVVYPYIAFLMVFGYAMDWILRYTIKFWCPWYTKK